MAVNNGPGLGISPGYYECDPRQLSYRKQKETAKMTAWGDRDN